MKAIGSITTMKELWVDGSLDSLILRTDAPPSSEFDFEYRHMVIGSNYPDRNIAYYKKVSSRPENFPN